LLSLNPDTQLVAEQVREAGAFLQQLQQNGELKKDLAPLPVRVGYHTPCHLKALAAGVPLRSLLELIPELEVVPLDHGCSGMAGTFGLTRRHFDQSLAIGQELIDRLRDPDVILGATECSSCRIQMEQDSPVSTVHPLKLLAAAYGLMPDLRARFMKLARDRRLAERS
jgi:Fe-S oxidoreductase